MTRPRNPFKPTFGSSPPLLVGRDQQQEDFAAGLDDGPGSPDRATLYTGARGAGKTVMLNAVQDLAQQRGWIVISENPSPGLLTRLTQEALPARLMEQDPHATRTRLKGLSLPGNLGAQWETTDQHVVVAGLRSQMTALSDVLAEQGTGLLLTIDELHHAPSQEIIVLCSTIQHLFREDREVAFAGAGLPAAVSDLLNDRVLTFLRRAARQHLGAAANEDVARALSEPIRHGGRTISDQALTKAVQATAGYPFLIQLVGHSIWRQHPAQTEITIADVDAGTAHAARRLGSLVHGPSLRDCSQVDRSYLLAMAKDENASRTSDVARRLNVSVQYAGQYRQRLIDTELITATEWGSVAFTLPFMREYLREHAAFDAVPE